MNHAKRRRSRRNWTRGAVATFLFVWVFFLLYAHSYLVSLQDHHQPAVDPETPKNQVQEERSTAANPTTNNPFYGWQAETPSLEDGSKDCSIRKCFETEHDCASCRDLPEQMGSSPPPDPGPDWVPDVTMLHRMYLEGKDRNGKPWPPPLSTELCETIGVFGGRGDSNKELFDAVPIVGEPFVDDGPKIFCGVYTMGENHATNIRAMRETWAPQCDGFLAFSTATDPRIPAISLEHEGPEEYNNMWQKVRSIWRFIGQHYLSDYDYFILGGEDLFVLPANLRKYLVSLGGSPDIDDHFVGRRFKGYGEDNYFNSGGAGYVLSRATLRKFFETGLDHPQCNPKRHTPMEDVMTAECLRNVFSIGLTDTRDEQGRERFHPFAPGGQLTWKPPKPDKHDWYEDYNTEWGLLLGAECCAPDSVSFHYIKKPAMVRHLFSLLYNCPPSAGRRYY